MLSVKSAKHLIKHNYLQFIKRWWIPSHYLNFVLQIIGGNAKAIIMYRAIMGQIIFEWCFDQSSYCFLSEVADFIL